MPLKAVREVRKARHEYLTCEHPDLEPTFEVFSSVELAFRTSGHRFGPPFGCRQVMLV